MKTMSLTRRKKSPPKKMPSTQTKHAEPMQCASDKCSHSQEPTHSNTKFQTRIRKIGGQVSGIEKMINENRYCPEILVQIRAAKSALHSLELQLLESHIRGCVVSAIQFSNTPESELKIRELMEILR